LRKASRFLDVLQEIARDPVWSDRLVTKGGTALILFHLVSTASRSISVSTYLGGLGPDLRQAEPPRPP
jgi:hypothetical protein